MHFFYKDKIRAWDNKRAEIVYLARAETRDG